MLIEVPMRDIWDYPAAAIVIPTNMTLDKNGNLVMGAGLAKQARDRFPQLAKEWGMHYGKYPYLKPVEKLAFSYCTATYAKIGDREITLISFPTKFHWKDNSDLVLIANSAKWLKVFAPSNFADTKWITVMSQVGCGLGKLKWDRVKTVLDIHLGRKDPNHEYHVLCPAVK